MKRALLILILLLGSVQATVTYVPPSPANGSTVVGSSATFNWTTNAVACVSSALTVYKNGSVFADFPGLLCNSTQSLANLSAGSYSWQVNETAVPPDSGPIWAFTDVPQVNSTIVYPPNNTIFGPKQCWSLVKLNTTDSEPAGASRSSSCRFYYQELNGSWTLRQTFSLPSASGSFNFTNYTEDGYYSVNCTTDVSGTLTDTSTVKYQIIGVGFCADNVDDPQPGINFLALVVLGFGLIYVGIEGEDV